GRARIAGRIAEARAESEAADLLARDDREHVRLIEIEASPRFVALEAALASADRIREPTEEAFPQLLPEQERDAVALAFTVLRERAREEWIAQAAAHDEVLQRLLERDDVGGERVGDAQRFAGAHVRRA